MEIYVGNIPPNTKSEELSNLCQSYGTILFIDIKNRCKPPFAFILFDNAGSASNAAKGMHGYTYKGHTFQVKVLQSEDYSEDTTESVVAKKKKLQMSSIT